MAQPFTIEPDPNTLDHPPAFLANGGAVGKLLLSLDAAGSPLGPPDAWSASLKTTMATLLPAKAQIVLFLGRGIRRPVQRCLRAEHRRQASARPRPAGDRELAGAVG